MKKTVLLLIIISVLGHLSLEAQTKRKSKRTKLITTTNSTTSTTTVSDANSSNTAPNSSSNTSSSSSSNSNLNVGGINIGNIGNQIGGLLGGGSGSGGNMTQDLAAKGLREALSQGANLASSNLGKVDGFLANAAVKILMPPEAQKIESTLRSIGMGSLCDNLITSVNHAAESAVVEAKPIFASAITGMSIQDAIAILTGGNNSATTYLRSTTGQALMSKFEPIIKSNLDRANATSLWSTAMNAYNQVPFVQKVNPNLAQYVTQKATDGIFLMVSQEEMKIRQNPSAQLGGVLQDVFGWASKNMKK